tara:strand:+ start:319 stop:1107 length:789 start_codon:yes stop_codon:yes gene_type:complete
MKDLKILITNDDGINAPGIKLLNKVAREFSNDITIIAPEREQSGRSQAMSLSDIIRLRQLDENVYSISGTPTDCVMLAIKQLMKDDKPDLILSGVNRGQNLADDINYSGTIGAAMEGAIHNIKSIAFSQVFNIHNEGKNAFDASEKNLSRMLNKLIELDYSNNVVLNVNFPDVFEKDLPSYFTCQGKRDVPAHIMEERIDPRGQKYYWIGFKRAMGGVEPGTDLACIYDGKISITPVSANRTDMEFIEKQKYDRRFPFFKSI